MSLENIKEPVIIFKCPCVGNKFKLAGKPKEKPSLKEKMEYVEYIGAGCTIITIQYNDFVSGNWEWCPLHC